MGSIDTSAELVNLLVISIMTLLVVVLLVAVLARRYFKRKEQIPEEERLDLQAALLDAIQEASANRRSQIDIRTFWWHSGVSTYQKNAIIDPLIKNHNVQIYNNSTGSPITDALRSFIDFALYRPPTHLILTDRTWEQMVQKGMSGQTMVIERVGTMNWQSQHTDGGDIVGSPQTSSGLDSEVRIGSVLYEAVRAGMTDEMFLEIVTALREDATRIPLGDDRDRVRELADKFVDQASGTSPDEDLTEGMLQRARRYVTEFSGLMSSTAKVFETWADFQQ